ncbi:MAG: DegT/DnrJ/EryC1/StrS family aminotransferase [Calditrichaeota bacterium]|nr:MAG: DegT/DnrJ/EryC1/StrS family aminotransferase [Calditrichota bacterium]
MKKIPLVDLKAQYASIREEIDGIVAEVIENTAFIGGKYLQDFEKSFAEYCEAEHCIAVSNGTDALFLALKGLGIGPGDEVITVVNTFIATSEAISHTGATIRFVDIDPFTRTMDIQALENAITEKTKAILPVHIFGHPAEMDAINQIARQHDLFVVEDAAQAHGARYKGKRIGSLGKAACFSFYPGKNLGAFGDAGAIVTNDAKFAENAVRLRNHGRLTKYEHSIEGYNHRCDALQAAILNTKLRHLDHWTEKRRAHAKRYNEFFSDTPEVIIPGEREDVEAVYHLYVIEVPNRDRVLAELNEKGIGAGIHYPVPLHLQPAYSNMNIARGQFPEAERSAKCIISLPLFPELTEEQIQRVADAVKLAVKI